MRSLAAGAALVVAMMAASFVLVMLIVTGAGGDGRLATAACATDANLAPMLVTIRTIESAGDYTAQAAGSSASGAYQFIDATWAGYGGYRRAADAPVELQDQKAADMVRTILTAHDNSVAAVPVVWYLGRLPAENSPEWDAIPAPEAGNRLTPREYQARWITQYDTESASTDAVTCMTTVGAYGDVASSLDCSTIQWGGFPNGQIPSTAMRYRPHSGYLHPAASASFDEMYAAAQAAGLDLTGSGYRPASAGGNTAGRSCHGVGLAIDVAGLVVGNRYPTADAAFESAEFAWVCANAEVFGWITPRWAIPNGMVCGSVVGTGSGGNVGDRCCFLEPWHLEAAGTVTTHPDFDTDNASTS